MVAALGLCLARATGVQRTALQRYLCGTAAPGLLYFTDLIVQFSHVCNHGRHACGHAMLCEALRPSVA
jgi:hypothetical protein